MWPGKFSNFNASLSEIIKAGRFGFSKRYDAPKQEELVGKF